MMVKVAIFLILLIYAYSSEAKCGYESCNPVKDGMINVHLVPHTHDDVGWLKTVDQYFYGDRNDIQVAGVQYILDSVIDELQKNSSRRFIYVEIGFFARWWREQSESVHKIVRNLVNNGQLEFILGGWSMDDEAASHYNAMIDEHTLGFKFLNENFGKCGRPRVAWQIDPFGHSREHASLFARMGYDGLFFGRLDYQDKENRMKTKTMEMVWQGSPTNLGNASDLFTGVLFNGYGPPRGFCFDIECRDDPIMDDKRLHDYNVDEKVKDFINATLTQAESYATNHLIMTMGSDFQYQNAHIWYKNLDKLIHYVNQQQNNGSKINLLYSTPSCYLYQLNRANLTWPTKQDDFFPYAHIPHGFWTGFYTSRPALKHYVRRSNNFLQACKQIDSFHRLVNVDDTGDFGNVETLKEAMGVLQHHDAVSGTEKQAVAYDYALRLASGVNACQEVMNNAFKKIMPLNSTSAVPGHTFCTLLNISFCPFTEHSEEFTITIYNPLAREVPYWVRIPVSGSSYTVKDRSGKVVPVQVVPLTNETKRIPERNGSVALNSLVFAAALPPLGYTTYTVQVSVVKEGDDPKETYSAFNSQSPIIISNTFLSATFDGTTGTLMQMKNLKSGVSADINQQMMYYISHWGNRSEPEFQGSGAYIFRPNQSEPSGFAPLLTQQVRIIQGKLVQEVHQHVSPWVSLVTRLYQDAPYLEMEWTVGPIPQEDKLGREVISKFCTDLKTDGVFFTDANGREVLQRKRDYRPTWNFNNSEPVAGNYFPVNSRIYLQDQSRNLQFTVLNDRSQGGGSIQDGCLELMVHRRLVVDDNLGVAEALNETGADGKGLIVRGKYYIFLDTIPNSPDLHRNMALKLYMEPVLSFSPISQDVKSSIRTEWSALSQPLPPNVHMLTLEYLDTVIDSKNVSKARYLLRFEHIFEKNEGPLSEPAKISLKGLFADYEVTSAEEMALGANINMKELHKLPWQYKAEDSSEDNTLYWEPKYKHNPKLRSHNTILHSGDENTIVLNPMEIKTFQVALIKKAAEQNQL